MPLSVGEIDEFDCLLRTRDFLSSVSHRCDTDSWALYASVIHGTQEPRRAEGSMDIMCLL